MDEQRKRVHYCMVDGSGVEGGGNLTSGLCGGSDGDDDLHMKIRNQCPGGTLAQRLPLLTPPPLLLLLTDKKGCTKIVCDST